MYIVTETQIIKIFEKKNSVTPIQLFCILRAICSRCAFQIWFTTEIEIDELFLFVSGALYSKLESVYSEVKTGWTSYIEYTNIL